MIKKLILIFTLIATVAYSKDVTLSWDPSPTPTVTHYKLYYDNQPNPPFANPVEAGLVLNHFIANLPDDEDHWFAVTALDAANNESVYSNIVKSDKIIHTLPELDLEIEWQFLIEGR